MAEEEGDVELLPLTALTPHPRNYRDHPPDQIEQLKASITQHGFYKNIVVARDNTILAGHGIVKAAGQMGIVAIPAKRLDIDPDSPQALRIVAGDNELGHLAEINDRGLADLLSELNQDPTGLLGTGYDEMMLANLVFITRNDTEVPDFDAAAEWAGMPEYTPQTNSLNIIIQFQNEDDRQRFLDEFKLREAVGFGASKTKRSYSGWWPPRTELLHDGGLRYSQPEE